MARELLPMLPNVKNRQKQRHAYQHTYRYQNDIVTSSANVKETPKRYTNNHDFHVLFN